MPSFSGALLPSGILESSAGFTPALDDRARFPLPPFGDDCLLASALAYGARTSAQPVATLEGANGAGARLPAYLDDFYYRVHVRPSRVDLGNLLSTQIRPVEVWNAHFDPKLLSSIGESGTDGITLNAPANPPTTFGGLESRAYTATVTTAGPAVISGAYTFNFPTEAPVLLLVGRRIIAFPFRPNWREPVVERLEWLTNVLEAYDGSEQRVRLRRFPRRGFEYLTMAANNAERRKLETILYDWQARVWGLPVWTDGTYLGVNLPLGASAIPVETATRDYEDGGLLILIDGMESEFLEIVSVGASSITTKTSTLRAWGPQTIVAPVRAARMAEVARLDRVHDEALEMKVRFDLEDGEGRAALAEAATYRGFAVLEQKPDASQDISSEFARSLTTLDFLTGKRSVDDRAGLPFVRNSYSWLLPDRATEHAHRQFLLARGGRWKPLWIPSWTSDLTLAQNVGAGASNIYVEDADYVQHLLGKVGKRDIRIRLKSGTIYYRRIINATDAGVPAGQEQLNLDSPLPAAFNVSDVDSIMFMALQRLDGDGVEIAWDTVSVARCSAMFRTLRDADL